MLHIKGDGSGLDISGNAKIQSLEAADVTINNQLTVHGELISKRATIEQLDVVKERVGSLEAADVTINNQLTVHGELIAKRATIEQLNGVSARLQTVESDYVTTTYLTTNYLTAKSVKTDYMEVANWTSAGKIKADRIDTQSIVSYFGSLEKLLVQGLSTNRFYLGGSAIGLQTITINGIAYNICISQ